MIDWTKTDPELAHTHAALLRAAAQARELARRFGTPLVVWRDGRIVELALGDPTPLPTAPATARP